MKKINLIFFILLLASYLVFFQQIFITQADSPFAEGLKKTGGEAGYTGSPAIAVRIGQVVGAILSFLGVVFLILMIYGGYIWMLARGNEQEAAKAKNIIKGAIIGLIIVLLAYIITVFVGGNLLF